MQKEGSIAYSQKQPLGNHQHGRSFQHLLAPPTETMLEE
jgi:hypothetical protein